jgi:starvation-inducible DNA-binding protein
MKKLDVKTRRMAPLETPTDLGPQATKDISAALNLLLADFLALYLKTKNFHWHVSGPHFRDYHLLLDDQADQLYATTDPIAERVRKLGGTTLHSIGQISRLQRVADNDADYVTPEDMLAELREDNQQLAARMRQSHHVCDEHGDVATASLIEVWIDEAERRVWFLYEAGRK